MSFDSHGDDLHILVNGGVDLDSLDGLQSDLFGLGLNFQIFVSGDLSLLGQLLKRGGLLLGLGLQGVSLLRVLLSGCEQLVLQIC